MAKTVVIAGGGASGLMAALAAARKGASVTVLEKENRPGKKILASGGGRCNLTNTGDAAGRNMVRRCKEVNGNTVNNTCQNINQNINGQCFHVFTVHV